MGDELEKALLQEALLPSAALPHSLGSGTVVGLLGKPTHSGNRGSCIALKRDSENGAGGGRSCRAHLLTSCFPVRLGHSLCFHSPHPSHGAGGKGERILSMESHQQKAYTKLILIRRGSDILIPGLPWGP